MNRICFVSPIVAVIGVIMIFGATPLSCANGPQDDAEAKKPDPWEPLRFLVGD